MKNKLEEGMYVKYTRGAINGYVPPRIGKIIERLNDSEFLKLDTNCTILENDVSKASHNIIDLIEVGDYVNGSKVSIVESEFIYWETGNAIQDKFIETIVTKEQFESMSYKVGDPND